MSRYDRKWVAEYYDDYGEKEWERMVRSPVDEISLHLHAHYLREHVPEGSRVLEIGAGAGRHTRNVLRGTGVTFPVVFG